MNPDQKRSNDGESNNNPKKGDGGRSADHYFWELGQLGYPSGDLSPLLDYLAEVPPEDTHNDRLSAVLFPYSTTLTSDEQCNYESFEEVYKHILDSASLGQSRSESNLVAREVGVRAAGPFRTHGGSVMNWRELTDSTTGVSLIPDLRALTSSEVEINSGLFLPEKFKTDTVRILHLMSGEQSEVAHEIAVLFNRNTMFEAVGNFIHSLREDYHGQSTRRYSYVRGLVEEGLSARVKEKMAAHFGALHSEDVSDMVAYMRASERVPEIIHAVERFSMEGDLLISVLVKMPPSKFDFDAPKLIEEITYEVSLDELGRLVLFEGRAEEWGSEDTIDLIDL